MPFSRYLPPEYSDGVDSIRRSTDGSPLASSRFVSLVVHGADDGDSPVTLMLAQWGQLIDHDLTSTAQPRSINGSIPKCCDSSEFHPSCFPIKVPKDDPWLAPLKVRCLEFLRSAPAQRRDCNLSWREQTNQVTSFIDASPVYSSNARTSDGARLFRNGLLIFGRGSSQNDVCLRGAIDRQCIRAGDGRSNEQPGLLALHHVWVGEHNRIALQLSELNPHWSDEKVYQEARRIVGAMFQHITYREFLPLVLGREVCQLFELELSNSGYYKGHDSHVNPTVANSFGAAAFRFGHSLIQGSYMRCDQDYNFLNNNVSLHEEFSRGDLQNTGSLHRLLRGMVTQRAQMRDEFMTPELTNHLFQSGGFPFGLDLAAINIQRGRDHGIPAYTAWREPCGLTPIETWEDLENVVGPGSAQRMSHAYRSVRDIDLFVGGIAERPVIGGLVGPTFACIIAQQFSNLRKGDRFWYENGGFENSLTPAQLQSIRRVSLAQVLCRAVGGGSFQPHIFIPHTVEGNGRIPCGNGPLTPIDLLPWIEFDPFLVKQNEPLDFHNLTGLLQSHGHNLSTLTDPQLSAFTALKEPVRMNVTKIHDKLDIKKKGSKPNKFNNQLDSNKRKQNIVKTETTDKNKKTESHRRTVIINNIAVELRQNPNDRKLLLNQTIAEGRKQNVSDSTRTKRSSKNTDHSRQYYSNKPDKYYSPDKQAVLLDSSLNEYEPFKIEIRIKTSNQTPQLTNYKPSGYDSDSDNNYNTVSTPFNYAITTTTRPKYTKPPTIIFVDERDVSTSRPFQSVKNQYQNFPTNPSNQIFGNGIKSTFNIGSEFLTSNTFGESIQHEAFNVHGSSVNNGQMSSFNINIKTPTQQSFGITVEGSTTSKPYNTLSSTTNKNYFSSNLHANRYKQTSSPFSFYQYSLPSTKSKFNNRLPVKTKRPYIPTSGIVEIQYKEVDDEDSIELKALLNDDDIDDNSSKTPLNKLTDIDDYYNDDIDNDTVINFDKDGYLRPEFMKLETLQQDFQRNITSTDTTETMDDFVLPILTKTDSKVTITAQQNNKNELENDSIPRRSGSDIVAEDDLKMASTMSTSTTSRSTQINAKPAIAFAPLNVLTSLERPDKWAIVDPQEKQPPLPIVPELQVNSPTAKEVPKPMKVQFNSIHWNKKHFMPSKTP